MNSKSLTSSTLRSQEQRSRKKHENLPHLKKELRFEGAFTHALELNFLSRSVHISNISYLNQAPVFQRVENTIHWINQRLDWTGGSVSIDSDLPAEYVYRSDKSLTWI